MAGTGWHDFGIPIEISILSCYPGTRAPRTRWCTVLILEVYYSLVCWCQPGWFNYWLVACQHLVQARNLIIYSDCIGTPLYRLFLVTLYLISVSHFKKSLKKASLFRCGPVLREF